MSLYQSREFFLCYEFQVVQDDCLPCLLGVFRAEDENALAIKQEGIHICNTDVCIADGANGIGSASWFVVKLQCKDV